MKAKRQSEKLSKLILLLPSLLLTACNDKTIPVTSITIDQGEVLNVKLRDEVYLSATMLPSDTTELYYHFVDESNHLPRYFVFNQSTQQFLTREVGTFTLKAYPGYAWHNHGREYYDKHPYDTITINVASNEEVEDVDLFGPNLYGLKTFGLYNGEYRWYKFAAPYTGDFKFYINGRYFLLELFNDKQGPTETDPPIFSFIPTEDLNHLTRSFTKDEEIYIRFTGTTANTYYDEYIVFCITTPSL